MRSNIKESEIDKLLIAPQQNRSRETRAKILDALETLLETKTLDQISMRDLGRESGCSMSSIYGRFKDKNALILAMHIGVRDLAIECVGKKAAVSQWKGKSIEKIIHSLVAQSVGFYVSHGSLIRAILYVDEPVIRQRQAEALQQAAGQYSKIFYPFAPEKKREIDEAVEASCELVASTMYVKLMFGEVTLRNTKISQRRFIRQLSCAVAALLCEAIKSEG